jgi:osmoprotectant transport system permease protein
MGDALMSHAGRWRWLVLALFTTACLVLTARTDIWTGLLGNLFPEQGTVVYPNATLLTLVRQHVTLVAISSGLTVLIGVPLGIWVTRPTGRAFQPLINDVTAFGQTFPPVAVLVLVVPLLGFRPQTAIVALLLYGLLPVVRNTIAGLRGVPPELVDAAHGMGMSRRDILWRVELPLAARVILAGIRISVVINIGTATVGAVIGAGGLGQPILDGLILDNAAFILQGAVPAAILAILADQLLSNLEGSFTPAT